MNTAALSAALMMARAEARRTPNQQVRREAGSDVSIVWQVVQKRGQPEAELLRLDSAALVSMFAAGVKAAVGAVLQLLPPELLLDDWKHKHGMLGLVMRTQKDRRRCLKCDWNTAATAKGSWVGVCTECAEKARLTMGWASITEPARTR
jgi:hypothetical protein